MASIDLPQSTPDMSFNSDGDTDCSTNRHITGIISMLESPVVKKEAAESENEISATQPVRILKDVVAFVEVRTGAENRSKAIVSKLRQLGAVVVDKLGDDVTHVIWKDGKKSTVDRARKRSIPVVTVLWVESCMQNETRVAENLFAVHTDKSKGTPIALPRLKKTKSMQPKDFDEDVASSAERGERIRKRKENKDKKKPKSPSAYFVAETQPMSPLFGSPFSPNLAVPDTPASLRERFNCIKRNIQELDDSDSDCPRSPIAVKPASSDELPLQRRLFGSRGVSPVSTPPSSPQPLSTSTQKSPSKVRVKCETIVEEPSLNAGLDSPTKDTSPTRRPLSPVTNMVHSPVRSVDSPPAQITSPKSRERKKKTKSPASPTFSGKASASQRRSQRSSLPQSTNNDGEGLSDTQKNRTIAKPRKKKLYSSSAQPEMELTVPTTTSSTKSSDSTVLGVSGIKARKGRSKNNNGVISELAGLPKQVKPPKRKRGKTSESDSDSATARKKSKSSSPSDKNSVTKRTRSRKSLETHDSISEQELSVSKNIHMKQAVFTEIRDGKVSSNNIPSDILQEEFESEYEESTLYLNTQSNVSKIWATTNGVTQSSQASSNTTSRKRSGKITEPLGSKTSAGQRESKVATDKDTSGRAASVSSRTTRRKSVAACTPPAVKEPLMTGDVKSPPKSKGRRKSVAVCSPARTQVLDSSESVDAGQSEPRKTRRRSAAVPEQAVHDSENKPESTTPTVTGRRRKSIVIPSPVAEEQLETRNNQRQSVTNKKAELNDPSILNTVEETPEIPKSKPRRRSGAHTSVFESQPVDITNKTIRTPVVSPAVNTPINRRRSMRMVAISNSMQKALTPMKTFHEDNMSTVETARNKDTTVANEISVASTSNKCPADFDSTGDESILQLAKKKKKKAHNSNQISRTQLRSNDSTASSDSGFSHVDDNSSNLSHASVFSPATNNRKSIDDFRPNTFNISTQKKVARNKSAKPSLSDIDSSEEESRVSTSRQDKSKKTKPKASGNKKTKPSVSDLASDVNTNDTRTKSKINSGTNSKSSRSSAESTCSSASDGNESKGKRSSGSKSPKYANSIVMTSLHYDEQDTVKGVVKKMGGFHIQEKVDSTTTHIVCGGNRRTLNILYAIAQGCWIVSQEWVFNSLEVGKWIDEEPFEVYDHFPACQISRLERATAKNTYKQDLFSQDGLIYVCEETAPPTRHLVDLVELGSGQITRCLRKADLVIGGIRNGYTCLSEQWVLDSITAHKSLPAEPYKIGVDGKLVRSPSPDY